MWILFFIGVGVMVVVLVSVMAYVAMHQPEEGAGEEKVNCPGAIKRCDASRETWSDGGKRKGGWSRRVGGIQQISPRSARD